VRGRAARRGRFEIHSHSTTAVRREAPINPPSARASAHRWLGTLWVDGTAVATNNNITINPSQLAGGNTPNNWIGRSQFADPLLNGAIDDFNIVDHALSQADIQALTAAITGPLSCSGNQPPPSHGGLHNDVTGPKTGQCAGL
jgi:Concanavalin A-like lectin/glucanases superfamily